MRPVVPDLPRLRFQAVHSLDVGEAYRLAVLSDAPGAFNIAADPHPGDLDVASPSCKPNRREIEMAGRLVDSLHDGFTAEDFSDGYRERVLALIAAKARGEAPEAPELVPDEDQPDLMAALEASLEGSRSHSGRGRSGSSAKSQSGGRPRSSSSRARKRARQ